MNSKQANETSKFLSFVLRHEPQAIGIELDREGWADVDALIAGAAAQGRELDYAAIASIVEGNDKKRFALSEDGKRIRAVQGHSTQSVTVTHVEKTPPEVLYHGTATRFLASIQQQGLLAGARHHVHLSQDIDTAVSVGKRYGQVVVLRVEAARLHAQGVTFFQADNGVWLVNHVPADALQVLDTPAA
ncbi:RNA 2'-phosphotransferase [Pigmentiphaga aceris]|uniref:Probable RNA 2'-phosphotransferase n=1 Tax=Pigmentiphaga aceris TaxID=1940612 RepID=A0A5C0AXF8_9BURK|nr:RNA 2'-phosphotransferase [Pigmentiphaga aceris]QEI07162.1 RNA 2'-phosphotransferase [Pigmentiphaga aceris]